MFRGHIARGGFGWRKSVSRLLKHKGIIICGSILGLRL